MRSVIVVWGAHGSGKTTLAQWVEASCPKALVIYGDTDKEWKGLQETKRKNILQLMRHLEAEPRHVLFEGMRFPTGVLPTFIEYANLTPDVRFVLLVGLSTPARML